MADPITYRDHLRGRLYRFDVPVSLHSGLIEYLAARRPTGGFLRAVLMNDLKEAATRADVYNAPALALIVKFLCNVAPSPAWGSPANVAAWLTDPTPAPELFE